MLLFLCKSIGNFFCEILWQISLDFFYVNLFGNFFWTNILEKETSGEISGVYFRKYSLRNSRRNSLGNSLWNSQKDFRRDILEDTIEGFLTKAEGSNTCENSWKIDRTYGKNLVSEELLEEFPNELMWIFSIELLVELLMELMEDFPKELFWGFSKK